MAATRPQPQQTSAIDKMPEETLLLATYAKEEGLINAMKIVSSLKSLAPRAEKTRQQLSYGYLSDTIDPDTNRTLQILIEETEPAKLEESDLKRYIQPVYSRDALMKYMKREIKKAPRGTIEDSRKILKRVGVSLSELIIQERRS